MKSALSCSLAVIALAVSGAAQIPNVQVNQQNKTISVTATHAISVEPEVATLDIGVKTSAVTREESYRQNLEGSAAVLKAMKDAQVPDSNIETERLQVQQETVNENGRSKPAMYVTKQSWKVRVAASNAQAVLDAAIKAGANDIDDPDWSVNDVVALEGRANGIALEQARRIAEQMAKGLGATLGDLVYASNTVTRTFMGVPVVANTMNVSIASTVRKEPVLKLFPKRVEKSATVVAVFSIK